MTAALALLEARGVAVRLSGGDLQMRAPSPVAAWAKAIIKRHREAILAELGAADEERTYLLRERAGILMDNGMTQAAADAAAEKLLEVEALFDAQDPLRRACRLVEAHFPEATMTIRKG